MFWRVSLLGVLLLVCTSVRTGQAVAVDAQQGASRPPVSSQQQLLNRYCITCHNERAKTADLMLDKLDLSNVGHDAATWEKVVRKVGAGVMPPSGRPRPDQLTMDGFRQWLELELDRADGASPNAGRTETFHRLNRAEYQNATRDLLGVAVDVEALLPGDDSSYGFDNMAGVLRFSPTLMERYLTAARRITRVAVGTPPAVPNFDVFRIAADQPQDDRLDDLPLGSRGGTLIHYNFAADGEYRVRVKLARQLNAQDLDVPRFDQAQELEISLDGERIKTFTLEAFDPTVKTRGLGRRASLDTDWQVQFFAKAGPRDLAITFLNSTRTLRAMLVKPYLRPNPPGTNSWSSRKGAYLDEVEVTGPLDKVAVGDTPGRRRIFVCHPAKPADETGCAKTILAALGRRAFRRPTTEADVQELLVPYTAARKDQQGFEAGIERAIQRLLVSPEFLFRTEADPSARGAVATNYAISDVELASRLSFFLWSSIPDEELLRVAEQGKLNEPAVLEKQVRRMLADSRSHAIVDNFVGQWLFLRNVPSLTAEPFKDPDFDASLRAALQRETELFLGGIIGEDRSLLELLTANYTYLNERLARHYGIPNVYGSHFRRVALPEGSQRGWLLGQGSILAVTSYANRTSPVKRGKWVLENILGTPPPSPPPDVPTLDEKQAGSTALTMRERMVQHRANPVCASCHTMMDPIGFALENFDQVGRWRNVDDGVDGRKSRFSPIDPSGVLPDGSKFDGPAGLRLALLSRSDQFMTTLTEKLLTYALGRGVEYYDQPAIRAIVRDARKSKYQFSSLVLGITNSLPFRMRRSTNDSH